MAEESNPRVLAESMRVRRSQNAAPYILLLGDACARAAGATLEAVARHILRGVEGTALSVSADEPDPEKLMAGFRDFLNAQDPSTREFLLRSDADLPTPVFYQDLASLIKTGYFQQILTTGVDRMLETCLSRKGWEEGAQYRVIRLLPNQKLPEVDQKAPEIPVSIVKLHGDLAKPELICSPDMIDAALEYHRRDVQIGLRGDLVCVGYEFECEPLMDWLRKSRGNELWFAHENPPDLQPLQPFETLRKVRILRGPDAEPGLFFAHLFDALLENPRSQTNLPLDELRASALEGQGKRGNEVLRRLERTAADAPDNTGIAAQIVQQRKDLGWLRGIEPSSDGSKFSIDINKYIANRSGVTDTYGILRGLQQSVRKSGADPDTTKLLEDLIDNVTRQIQGGKNPKLLRRVFDALAAAADESDELSADTKGLLRKLSGLREIL